jgi:hypothetical protein
MNERYGVNRNPLNIGELHVLVAYDGGTWMHWLFCLILVTGSIPKRDKSRRPGGVGYAVQALRFLA